MSASGSEETSSSHNFTGVAHTHESDKLGNEFVAHFWGVRGSYPAPKAGMQRVGGNTACVEVRVGGHEIILDAGTGLIPFGQFLRQRSDDVPPTLTILFSHLHYDHILGLPFFDPLYQAGATLHLAGPCMGGKSFKELICQAITSPYFPVELREAPATCRFYTLAYGDYLEWHPDDLSPRLQNSQLKSEAAEVQPLISGDVRVTFLHSSAHPRDGCLISRIEYAGRSLVFATDVEGPPAGDQALIRFARGADILIHDAQYREQEYLDSKHGFGHSTLGMATTVARAAGVKRLILFHHDPEYDDSVLEHLQQVAQREFPATTLAVEGLDVSLR